MAAPEGYAALKERCNAIEEAYEFMLAYAAQGAATDVGSRIREFLGRYDAALTGLTEVLAGLVPRTNPGPYEAFLAVVARDTSSSQAAIRLVLAQPTISSQVVDNLNASIHVRSLLTDLFLVDEILKTRQ